MFALDTVTGKELWRVSLGGETNAPPILVHIKRTSGDCSVGREGDVLVWIIAFRRASLPDTNSSLVQWPA